MSPLLVTLSAALTLGGVLDAANVYNSATKYPELRPELGKYQDFSKCFPVKEKWYMTYRSHEIDPGFGGKAKCLRGSVTGSMAAGTAPVLLGIGGTDTKATVTVKSTEGYRDKNALEFKTPQGSVDVRVAYVDCDTCKVFRHPYIKSGQDTYSNHDFRVYSLYTDCSTCSVFWSNYVEEGPACSLVVPESNVDNIPQHCHYIYDMHCGPTKYWIYDKSCGSKD
ncbi:uncharacterized protein LOC115321863 [Ixodes scapularis]|uniref:uncharacterized protein LOC115321863 n=1 Tax=Ixodes scapularis TaxID=6945 RepID=UPI001A9D8C96|nr:uncharacterized protein LOC115321863 [Ixodes scapularis]